MELTTSCNENVLHVLKMKHWHTFIFQTLDQYPDIEFHTLAIEFLHRLVSCGNFQIERTFILLSLSYTEIIHAVLRSTRRWIRASVTRVKADDKTVFQSQTQSKETEVFFKRLIIASICALSKIISVVEIVEDMKDKIFRYEGRFAVFFYRLVESIVFVWNHFENDVCHNAVASCIKNLLILVSEYGERSDIIVSFFNELNSTYPCATHGKPSTYQTTNRESSNSRAVRFDESNLRTTFQRSSSRAFKKLVKNNQNSLSYSILELCLQIFFKSEQDTEIMSLLETFELLCQLYSPIRQLLSLSNFLERLKIVYMRTENNIQISELCLNLYRIIMLSASSPKVSLCQQAIVYDCVELIEIFSKFTDCNISHQAPLDEQLSATLNKLEKTVSGFVKFNPAVLVPKPGQTYVEALLLLACQKSSIGIVNALLTSNVVSNSFLRGLVSRKDIRNDIKTEVLLALSSTSADGRLDWSGLELDNITPQFLASLSNKNEKVTKTKERFDFFA